MSSIVISPTVLLVRHQKVVDGVPRCELIQGSVGSTMIRQQFLAANFFKTLRRSVGSTVRGWLHNTMRL
jgi:hypothetical protein